MTENIKKTEDQYPDWAHEPKVLKFIEDVKAKHPDFSDAQLLQMAFQRLNPLEAK